MLLLVPKKAPFSHTTFSTLTMKHMSQRIVILGPSPKKLMKISVLIL